MSVNHVAVGAVLAGRYELTSSIASGGMAQVWRAHDEVLNRPVAVKILHAHLASDEAFVARFRREAIASARLQHSSIVAVYDTVSDDGVEAIVMELIEGRTLRTILDHATALPPSTTVQIGMQIADALGVAHSHGIVHRDIKPGNIMIDNEMRVVVTDFGIAKATKDADLTNTGTLLGTAKYLAPEQVTGDTIDPRTDLYSLGVVLFETLVGEPPWDAETDAATALARIQQPPPRCRDRNPSLPAALDAIIARAMAQHPDERFERAVVMRDALATADLSAATADSYQPPPPVASHDNINTVATADGAGAGIGGSGAGAGSGEMTNPGVALDQNPAQVPAPGPDGTAMMTTDMIEAARGGYVGAAPPATAAPAKAKPKRNWFGRTFLVLLFVAALITAGLLAMTGGFGSLGDLGTGGGEPIALAGATAVDPQGDGREREDRAESAVDGDDRTSWVTETYRSAGFSGLKDGVGLAVLFDGRQRVGEVTIQSTTEEWGAEFYMLDDAPPSSGWSDPSEVGTKIGEVSGATGDTTVGLDSSTGGGVLIWIVEHGTTVDNDGRVRNRMQIIEATFR